MDKKKLATIIAAVAYIIFALFITMNLPNIMSGGNPNVKTVLTTGQTAAISDISINLNSFSGTLDMSASKLKMGQTVYLTRQGNSPTGPITKISDKNNGEFFRAVIQSAKDNVISATQYAIASTAGSGFKPGIVIFQVLIFLTLILVPIVILAKNGLLSLDSLSFLSNVTLPKGKGKSNKYGDQGQDYIASVGELKELAGKDGYTVSKNFRLSASMSYEHVLVLGPTGAGKSTSFFIPNLFDLDGRHSAVVTDPKGEMYKICSPYLRSIGYNIIKLEPYNLKENDFRYNPIMIVKDDDEIHEIAQLILTNGGKSIELSTGSSSGNAEWINMAVPLFAAALAYVRDFGKRKSVTEAIDIILHDSLEELDAKFKKSRYAYRQFLIFNSSKESEKTMSSIKSVLTSNVQLFLQDTVENFTTLPVKYNELGKKSPNMDVLFDPTVIREKPTVVFVCVPEKKSTYMMPLMSVFYTQIFDMTSRTSDGYPVLFFLDEFANIGVIPTIANVAATARSRRIGLSLGLQGVEQLERNYGKENASDILNNLKTKLIYSELTGDSADYVSKLSGTTTVEVKSYSSGGGQGGTITESLFSGAQVQKSGTRRELLTASQVRTFDKGMVLIISHNKQPVFDKKNSYFLIDAYKKKAEIV